MTTAEARTWSRNLATEPDVNTGMTSTPTVLPFSSVHVANDKSTYKKNKIWRGRVPQGYRKGGWNCFYLLIARLRVHWSSTCANRPFLPLDRAEILCKFLHPARDTMPKRSFPQIGMTKLVTYGNRPCTRSVAISHVPNSWVPACIDGRCARCKATWHHIFQTIIIYTPAIQWCLCLAPVSEWRNIRSVKTNLWSWIAILMA